MKKILILEDELIIAKTIKLHLEQNNYDCVIAQNPTQAEKALQEYNFSALLCDINLRSKINGIEFVQQYVEDNLPVVFLTAYQDLETMKAAEETTPNAYLTKPFNKDLLLMTLNLAILNHKKRFLHHDSNCIKADDIQLSEREIEIVRLLAKSLTTSEIADELCISSQTVATHRKNIIRKTGVKSLIELVSIAVEKAWL